MSAYVLIRDKEIRGVFHSEPAALAECRVPEDHVRICTNPDGPTFRALLDRKHMYSVTYYTDSHQIRISILNPTYLWGEDAEVYFDDNYIFEEEYCIEALCLVRTPQEALTTFKKRLFRVKGRSFVQPHEVIIV